ncbi:transcriptional regulator [Herbihabitans rhizosphaerae]|uniref:Transcriptional regulator n=1 Tax=Herbihabitans rhizosphaerae TaxID=1872711 RepID=A0A4Q7L1R8_9PSEU|nr:winged helix-turn-helix domain-containing protein [Herbihabitans rhizosphaerae]RZS43137.1 transcriptional regulator [Herbihabitans rhizosphaerae]
MQTATRFVLRLNIDLPYTPTVVTAVNEMLGDVAEMPGVIVSTHGDAPWAAAAIPSPRPAPFEGPGEHLYIDPVARTVRREGVPIGLTRLEFDLLWFLAARPNRVQRREAVLAEVWGITAPIVSRTLDVHIRRLRKKLGPYGELITTVRGVGYRFDGRDEVRLNSELPDE